MYIYIYTYIYIYIHCTHTHMHTQAARKRLHSKRETVRDTVNISSKLDRQGSGSRSDPCLLAEPGKRTGAKTFDAIDLGDLISFTDSCIDATQTLSQPLMT